MNEHDQHALDQHVDEFATEHNEIVSDHDPENCIYLLEGASYILYTINDKDQLELDYNKFDPTHIRSNQNGFYNAATRVITNWQHEGRWN